MAILSRLVIPGRLMSQNDYIKAERQSRYAAAEIKRKTERDLIEQIQHQLQGLHYDKPVHLAYTWYEADRRRDHDNVVSFGMKVIQDSLVKAHVIDNDGWKGVAGFSHSFEVDKDNPRIVVEITEVMK